MKYTYLLPVTAFVAVLFTASPAYAFEGKGDAGLRLGLGAHVGELFHSEGDAHARAEVRAKFEERKQHIAQWRERTEDRLSHISAGVVTSINGSVFTIDPFGAKSTTTVSTNADTTFKVKGEATSSSALTVGSKVFLFGTTTATSSTGDSFTASLVKVFERGWGHMKFWFGVGSHNK